MPWPRAADVEPHRLRRRQRRARRAGAAAAAFVILCAIACAPPARAEPPSPAPIDLATALRLAGAGSLQVRIARERQAEAEADYQAARLRFLPWLTLGIGYRNHQGNLQDVVGEVFPTDKQSYTGGGGLAAEVELGDAWYGLLAAQQRRAAAKAGADAGTQDAVLRAAFEWFDLVRTDAQVAVAGEAVRIAIDYAGQLEQAVAIGLAQKPELLRVQVQRELRRQGLRRAEEARRLAAARLATTLRLDPSVALAVPPASLAPLALAAPEPTSELIARALGQRPEIRRIDALTRATASDRDAARYGPLVPSFQAQTFWGGLGGGRDGRTTSLDYSADYSVGLSWRIGPSGLFDLPRVRQREARLEQHRLEGERVRDDVREQVVAAVTRAGSLADQLGTAQKALALAEDVLALGRQRREFGVASVLEFIQSEQDLTRARGELVEAIAEYNKAQYALRAATGDLGG